MCGVFIGVLVFSALGADITPVIMLIFGLFGILSDFDMVFEVVRLGKHRKVTHKKRYVIPTILLLPIVYLIKQELVLFFILLWVNAVVHIVLDDIANPLIDYTTGKIKGMQQIRKENEHLPGQIISEAFGLIFLVLVILILTF